MNKWTEAGIENLKLRVSIVLGEKFHTCKQSLMECSVLDWGFKGIQIIIQNWLSQFFSGTSLGLRHVSGQSVQQSTKSASISTPCSH